MALDILREELILDHAFGRTEYRSTLLGAFLYKALLSLLPEDAVPASLRSSIMEVFFNSTSCTRKTLLRRVLSLILRFYLKGPLNFHLTVSSKHGNEYAFQRFSTSLSGVFEVLRNLRVRRIKLITLCLPLNFNTVLVLPLICAI